jgi:hypothetical protein
MIFPPFKWVVMLQRYNMPYGRQKPLGHFFIIFLQNTKHNNIVDNFGIYDRIETKLNHLMCMDIAGLDKFNFHNFARKLSNKYVGATNDV